MAPRFLLPLARRKPEQLAIFLLLVIMVMAWGLRSVHRADWDGYAFLIHPDEYHVGDRVTMNLRVPDSFGAYLRSECEVITGPTGQPMLINPRYPNPANPDPATLPPLKDQEPSPASGCNSLNPRNLNFAREHVYGSWPTTVVRYLAEKLYVNEETSADQLARNDVVTLGRVISTVADLGIIGLIYLLGRRLANRRVGLLGALLYAFAPLPIQQAHFYTVDPMAAFYGLLTLYCCVLLADGGGWKAALASGVSLGFAVACKINMAPLALIVIVAAMQRSWQAYVEPGGDAWAPRTILGRLSGAFSRGFGLMFLAGLATLLTMRVAIPDAFRGHTFFDFIPDERFIRALGNARVTASAELDFPPSHQFASRALWIYDWSNMVVWGMGVPLGVASWLGLLGLGVGMARRASRHLVRWLPLWAWVSFYFVWQGGQPIKPMRYQLPIYGPLILFGAWGIVALIAWARKAERPLLFTKMPWRAISMGLAGVVIATTVLWGWGFSRIYARTHPRIAASEWVKRNIPPGSVLSWESWDIGISNIDGTLWPGEQMYTTNEDGRDKVEMYLDILDRVDYVTLTSNRAYGSLPQLPMRFPMALNYYRALFDGSLGFEKVADFSSYPSFLGIEISDQHADESWSVYDHPRVTIYRKTGAWNREVARAILLRDVNIDETYQLKPIDATPIPTMLQLTVERWNEQRASAGWAASFGGLANHAPLVAWLLAIEALGLAAWGLLWRMRLPLADRGLSAARMLGLLAVAFGAWLPAALQWWAFSRLWIALVAVGFLALGGAALWRERAAMLAWARANRSAIIASQSVYFGAFALLLLIRILNPDLWHPAMGGEKPMNMAYLVATLRTEVFPPYDPWFAGGMMNYYYWGYVLVGTPMKLLGLDPAYGFNLALPTLYGLTAQLAGGVGFNLYARGGRVRRSLERRALAALVAAAIGLVLLGNLAQVVLYANGLRALGNPEISFTNPEQSSQNLWLSGGSPLSDALAGVAQIRGGAELPFRTEWPYWNATRIVPGTINEFPYFSFLYGDLHAHVIALPLTVLALLGLVLLWELQRARRLRGVVAAVAALGFLVGALRATNTWDYPTFLVLTGVGMAVALIKATADLPWRRRWLWIAGGALAWYAALNGLWAPFTKHMGTGSYEKLLFVGYDTRMTVRDLAVMYGLWLWVLLPWLAIEARRQWGRSTALLIAGGVALWVAVAWVLGPTLEPAMERPQSVIGAWVFDLINSVLREPLRQRGISMVFVVPLLGVAAALLWARLKARMPARRVLPLAWLTAALGLLLFTETIVIPGAGRMNMVFKFGYQVWTLLALAAASVVPALWARRSPLRVPWAVVAGLLAVGALWYPLSATPAKVADRYVADAPRGLDGMAWMDAGATWNENGEFVLASDAAAIRWLRENVAGTPIILEGVTSPYRWTTRVATWTGLPTIIGWDGHQAQQRAPTRANAIIDHRKTVVRDLYTLTDLAQVRERLDLYGVQLIYVGPLERNIYAADGNQATFDQLVADGSWRVAYDSAGVRIYERLAAAPPPAHLPPDFKLGVPPADPLKRISLTRAAGDLPDAAGFADSALLDRWPLLGLAAWLLVLEALALLAWPLALLAFRSHGAAAWGLSKTLGIVVVGWVIWFPASLGMVRWSRWSILAGIAVLALLGWAAWRGGAKARAARTWAVNRRALLITQAVYLGLFALFAWMRAANPDLWHPYWGGEKPFEQGFLNAILRSSQMPPVDPFFSGGTINYYYYGLYLMALPMKLLGMDSAIGFNLAVASVGALVGVGAWSVALLIARRLRVAAVALACVALLGNLAGVLPMGVSSGMGGVVRAYQACDRGLGVERPACGPVNSLADVDIPATLTDAATNGTLDGFSSRLGAGTPWFWGPSRVINTPELDTINEFPYWSIIFADLHPHLIAVPLTLLVIALAFEASRRRRWRAIWPSLALLPLPLGALIASNAWDFPTYALVVLVAFALRGLYAAGGFWLRVRVTVGWVGLALVVIAAAVLAYAPFLGAYEAPVGGIWPIRIGTPLLPWLLIFGPFGLVIGGWMLLPRWRALPKAAPSRDQALPTGEEAAAGEDAAHSHEPEPIAKPSPTRKRKQWLWMAGALLIGALLVLGQAVVANISTLEPLLSASVGVRLVVLAFGSLVVVRLARARDPWARWALVLAGVGAAVALGVELVFVRDHLAPLRWEDPANRSERMNTVFKFGYQVWVLWGLSAALVVMRLLARLRRQSAVAYGLWAAMLGAMALGMAFFTIIGPISRSGTRFPEPPPGLTLDGQAFMATGSFSIEGTAISLADDGRAIDWINQNITGTAVLLQSEEWFYRTYGVRLAANTGLPTVVSALHADEQRPGSYVAERVRDIQRIYSSLEAGEIYWLLHKYAVDYVYFGSIEARRFPEAGERFRQLGDGLEVAYADGAVTIFRTRPTLRALAHMWRPNMPQPSDPGEAQVPPPPPPPPTTESPDLAAAIAAYESDPSNAGYAFEAGRQLWANGQGERAAAILRTAADANPGDVALHHVLGDVLLSLGRYEEAVMAYQQGYMTTATPENLNKLGTGYLAWAAIDREQLVQAELIFNDVIAQKPEVYDAYYHLGETQQLQGDIEAARASYETYLEKAPTDGLWVKAAQAKLATLR